MEQIIVDWNRNLRCFELRFPDGTGANSLNRANTQALARDYAADKKVRVALNFRCGLDFDPAA